MNNACVATVCNNVEQCATVHGCSVNNAVYRNDTTPVMKCEYMDDGWLKHCNNPKPRVHQYNTVGPDGN